MTPTHEFIEPHPVGRGYWRVNCRCGWFAVRYGEMLAMDAFAEHVEPFIGPESERKIEP